LAGGETVIRISLGTYKLFYEAGCEDFIWRTRSAADLEVLGEQAKARDGERQRCQLLL
jgi:paired amphipathic helix protein Sin3a